MDGILPHASTIVDLSAERPPWDDACMGDELVQVLSTPSATEGQLAKGRLEAEGIPVLLKGEGEGPYRMGPATLFVASRFEARARLILEDVAANGRADDDATSNEASEPNAD
jgi:putative signal transducing protein